MNKNNFIENRILGLQEPLEAEFLQPLSVYRAEEQTEDSVHLRDFLVSVRRHLWLIIGITLMTTTLMIVYMARQPDLYEARGQVQVDLETVSAAFSSSKSGAFIVNPVNDPAYFNTQLQILTGQRLLRRVVKTLDLEHDPNFRLPPSIQSGPSWQRLLHKAGLGETLAAVENNQAVDEKMIDNAASSDIWREDLAESARLAPYVEAIQEGLKAEPVKEIRLPIKETRLINITFSHPDRQTAAKVVNAIADTFALSNLERKTDANTSTGSVLQQRVAELQSQIRRQESQLLDYARNHQILSLEPGQNTVVERLTGLNRQLLEAENERKVAEAAYRAALDPRAADALAEGTVKEAAEVRSKIAELWQRRAQLLVENTEEWPEVKESDGQIAALEKQLTEMRDRATSVVLANLSTRYRQTLTREQSLRAAFDRQRAETLTQNEAAINYRIMQQEIETNKNLLDGMLQRSKENEAVLAGLRNNIHVNDYAIAPLVPVGPKRLLNTGVAFALSLAFSIGLAVFLGYIDGSVRSADDMEKMLHLPALATIPLIGGRRRLLTASRALRKRNGNGHAHAELLLNADAPAPLTEAYRHLRTAMLLPAERGELKSLLVTSSMPGEGKTTLAINTAVSLMRSGALVLVVDADLRKPRLHLIFDFNNEKGLSTILSSEMVDVEVLGMVKHHEESGLDVLTSGPILPDSAELLGVEKMRHLLGVFQTTYDYVIVDSPPLAYFADGVLISSVVDGVVLVVSSGKSTPKAVRHAYQTLQEVGASICGVVLNNVKELKYDYKHYYKQS